MDLPGGGAAPVVSRFGPRGMGSALAMIDNFAIGLTHALLALVAWRIAWRADLDREPDGGLGSGPGNGLKPANETAAAVHPLDLGIRRA